MEEERKSPWRVTKTINIQSWARRSSLRTQCIGREGEGEGGGSLITFQELIQGDAGNVIMMGGEKGVRLVSS